jgi:hypothetical protein
MAMLSHGVCRGIGSKNRVVAHGSGPYVFLESRPMVTAAIADAYARMAGETDRIGVSQRATAPAPQALDRLKLKNHETEYRHSENDLNE